MADKPVYSPLMDAALGNISLVVINPIYVPGSGKVFAYGFACMRNQTIYQRKFLYRSSLRGGADEDRAIAQRMMSGWGLDGRNWKFNSVIMKLITNAVATRAAFVIDASPEVVHKFHRQLQRAAHAEPRYKIPTYLYDLKTILMACNYKPTLTFEGDRGHPLDQAVYSVRLAMAALRYNYEIDVLRDMGYLNQPIAPQPTVVPKLKAPKTERSLGTKESLRSPKENNELAGKLPAFKLPEKADEATKIHDPTAQ